MTTDFPTAPSAYGLNGPAAAVTVEKSIHASHTEILTPPLMVAVTVVSASAFAGPASSNPATPGDKPATLVFEFHKYAAARIDQAYSIKVFDDGLALYEGKKYVKTMGAVPIQLTQESVHELLSIASRFGPETYTRRENPWPEQWVLLVLAAGETRTIYSSSASFPDPSLADYFYASLERLVPTHQLRCPFVLSFPSVFAGTDVCRW